MITRLNVTANNEKTSLHTTTRKKKNMDTSPTNEREIKEGAEETIKRALAIRHMELPVGEFISQGLERTVPSAARTLLESNVKDEVKHDLALGFMLTPTVLIPKLNWRR